MTSLKELLQQLDEKKAELGSLRPLKPEWQRKLDNKYRLEWNFHSNHIEGNTLTYGETQMLLFFGKATGEHEKRDYDEMEAHDAAIKIITEWAKEKDRDITESEIRELNKIILVKPFWKEAITPDGSPTRKEIVPGQYKTSPNSVRLRNGEIHNYASPEETPAKMNELFTQYVKGKGEHPLIRAAKAHHGFTSIHPFDDGNGRVARLWVNYILLRSEFPPLIIRVENKEKYLTALQKADIGDLVPFILYLIEEMNWSLDKAIDAAQGKSIEEPGDLDKEIALLDKQISLLKSDEAKISKSEESISMVIEQTFFPLIDHIHQQLEPVKKWFNHSVFNFMVDGVGEQYSTFASLRLGQHQNERLQKNLNEISFEVQLKGFIKGGQQAFNSWFRIKLALKEWKYELILEEEMLESKLYGTQLLHDEINSITEKCMRYLISNIKKQVQELGKKKS